MKKNFCILFITFLFLLVFGLCICTSYAEQAYKILDPKKTEIRYNAEWLAKITFAELINLAANFTIQQFVTRENFHKRWENGDPIYLHETFYSLMQGYDAYMLQCDVQIGGTDQLFNIVTAARKIMTFLGAKPNIAIILDILPGTDGEVKMSKSLGNFYTLEDLEKKGISPETFRFFVVTNHYRTSLNYTDEAARAAGKASAPPRTAPTRATSAPTPSATWRATTTPSPSRLSARFTTPPTPSVSRSDGTTPNGNRPAVQATRSGRGSGPAGRPRPAPTQPPNPQARTGLIWPPKKNSVRSSAKRPSEGRTGPSSSSSRSSPTTPPPGFTRSPSGLRP